MKNIIILLCVFFISCSYEEDKDIKINYRFKEGFEYNKQVVNEIFDYLSQNISKNKINCKINKEILKEIKDEGIVLTKFNFDIKKFEKVKGSKKIKDYLIRNDNEFIFFHKDPEKPDILVQKGKDTMVYNINKDHGKWSMYSHYKYLKTLSGSHSIFLIRIPQFLDIGFFDDNGELVIYDYLSPNHIMKEDEIIKKLEDPLKFFKSIQKRDEEMSIKYKNEK